MHLLSHEDSDNDDGGVLLPFQIGIWAPLQTSSFLPLCSLVNSFIIMPSHWKVLVNLLRKHDLHHPGVVDNAPNNTERIRISRLTVLVINLIVPSRTSSNTPGFFMTAAVSTSHKPIYVEPMSPPIIRHVQFRRKRQRWHQETTVAIGAQLAQEATAARLTSFREVSRKSRPCRSCGAIRNDLNLTAEKCSALISCQTRHAMDLLMPWYIWR